MAEDLDITFTHDVAGEQTLSKSSDIGITAGFTIDVDSPLTQVAQLTFYHSVAGTQTLSFASELGVTTAKTQTVGNGIYLESDIGITPELQQYFILPRKFAADLGITAGFTLVLNVGFTDVIMFGDLTLNKAIAIDWDEISLNCREAKIWDGSVSLQVDTISGFYGRYRFFPTDYNDIYSLLAKVGTKQTLRIYGVPYRNCMIFGTIKKKQVKPPRLALWGVEVEFRQDTCFTGQTA